MTMTPLIRGRLPDYVKEQFPEFAAFMVDNYRFLETEGAPLQIAQDWRKNMDPSTASEPFMKAILLDMGWDWSSEITISDDLLMSKLRDFYLSRGTKQSFRFLFSVLFGESVQIEYPRERMLITSGANYVEDSLIFTTATKINSNEYDAILRELQAGEVITVTGFVSGSVANIESINVYTHDGERHLRIAVMKPDTDFIPREDVRIEVGKYLIVERLHNILGIRVKAPGSGFVVGQTLKVTGPKITGVQRVTTLKGGSLGKVTIVAPGVGYAVGDTILALANDAEGFGFTARVKTVGAGGEIEKVEIRHLGYNYTAAPDVQIKSATGTGATLIIEGTEVGGIQHLDYLLPYANFDLSTVVVDGGSADLEPYEMSVWSRSSYKDRVGVLSEASTLIDSDRYQHFSYDIVSAVDARYHRDIVGQLLHPAGYIRTGVLSIERVAVTEVEATANTTIEKDDPDVSSDWLDSNGDTIQDENGDTLQG